MEKLGPDLFTRSGMALPRSTKRGIVLDPDKEPAEGPSFPAALPTPVEPPALVYWASRHLHKMALAMVIVLIVMLRWCRSC